MPTSTKVLGYYRCSDILANALPKNSDDTQVLRDILSENALLHPGHPLHEKGTDGINTFLGKFANGKTRHLFSSAQVEYLRYWLHAVKLTTTILPVPSSESMFLEAEVSAVPRAYPSLKELRNTMKKTRKANSRIKAGGRDASLILPRITFERVRKLWGAQIGTWCALDFELYLGTQNIITEMGFSSVRWEDGQEKEERGHFTVEEHRGYLNGLYKTVERRMNYNAEFGQSVELTKAGLKDKVANLILEMHARGPVFLVFHDARGDIKTLNFLGAPIETAVYDLPDDTIPTKGIFIVDTQILFRALRNQTKDRRSLEHVCNELGIETHFLHNAGNDAEYTLQALREMASGGSVDLQAERRWPDIGATGGDVACQLPEQQTGVNYDLNTGALQDESYTAV
ncbi:hypothetical protein C8R46DRAFT_1106178 [Mycena filopes]|nr:hypothetical protein C8R46DRAFT_1106178 [Mycena filopes]